MELNSRDSIPSSRTRRRCSGWSPLPSAARAWSSELFLLNEVVAWELEVEKGGAIEGLMRFFFFDTVDFLSLAALLFIFFSTPSLIVVPSFALNQNQKT